MLDREDREDRGDGAISDYSEVHAEHERGDHIEQKKKKGKVPTRINLDEHQHLRTALKDQLSAPIDEYRVGGEGNKASGVSAGFVGATTENLNYMLKPGDLDRVTDARMGNATPHWDKRDAMQEYIAAGIYKRILYDRTPTIGLADVSNSTNVNDKGKLFIKSKFLEGFKDLDSVSSTSRQDLEGFEKVIAACLFAGELDAHGENLGVVGNKVVKIDHGRSGMSFVTDEKAFMNILEASLGEYDYEDIPINVGKLKDSVNEILQISEDEIEKIVASRIDNLKKSGFKLEKTITYFSDGDPNPKVQAINSYEELEKFYVDQYKQQQQALQKFSNTLDIISKIECSIDPAQQKDWQNGQWLQDIGEQDPIVWAIENNKNIEGKVPLIWAVENNKLIEGKKPVEYLREVEASNPDLFEELNKGLVKHDNPMHANTPKAYEVLEEGYNSMHANTPKAYEVLEESHNPMHANTPKAYEVLEESHNPMHHASAPKVNKKPRVKVQEATIASPIVDVNKGQKGATPPSPTSVARFGSIGFGGKS
jgi:hypothetical protein